MKRIPLKGRRGRGKFARVSDRDYPDVMRVSSRWWPGGKGGNYAVCRLNGKTVLMHRAILGRRSGREIHHRDDDGYNNQRENICHCTRAQNAGRQRPQKGRTSKYRGVSWHKHLGRWRAYICPGGKYRHLIYSDSEIVAARAYNQAARAHFKDFARPNNLNGSDSAKMGSRAKRGRAAGGRVARRSRQKEQSSLNLDKGVMPKKQTHSKNQGTQPRRVSENQNPVDSFLSAPGGELKGGQMRKELSDFHRKVSFALRDFVEDLDGLLSEMEDHFDARIADLENPSPANETKTATPAG